MQYLLKRLKLPKSAEISENYDHSKSNYVRGSNNCAMIEMKKKANLNSQKYYL